MVNNEYLFAYDEDRFLVRIEYKDIYFIETVKSSHYCRIVHRNGEYRLRADIVRLKEILSRNFYKTRSSTIVNLNYIKKIDSINRLIYFDNKREISCSYVIKNYTELKRLLRIRSYRR